MLLHHEGQSKVILLLFEECGTREEVKVFVESLRSFDALEQAWFIFDLLSFAACEVCCLLNPVKEGSLLF